MTAQINLKLSDRMFEAAQAFAELRGFDSLQDFLRELLRETLFEEEKMSGKFTALASEKALAKYWLTKEEDKAWEHLARET